MDRIGPDFRITAPVPGQVIPQREEDEVEEETPQVLLDALFSLPPKLVFPLRTIDATSPYLHGSLTIDDVESLLASQHNLVYPDVSCRWEDRRRSERIKELGTWRAFVGISGGGQEEQQIDIEVVRQEAGQEGEGVEGTVQKAASQEVGGAS